MPHPRLTPAMRSVLERMARAPLPPMHTLSPAQARAAYEAGTTMLEVPRAELQRVENFTVPARDGYALPVRLYADLADRRDLPWLLYLHGGGFTIGSIASHDILCRELARLSGCAVVSLDYRLAPEHRFPTAVHDTWDAFHHLATQGARYGLNPVRAAVGGDSAGGTLSAACALMARDAGLPLALQLLFYPGLAGHQDLPSHQAYGQGLLLDAALIDYFYDHYIADTERGDWRFAPLQATEVQGVAPAWLGLAECDPLADEGLAYADKLRAAGVPVQLEIYRGVVHEFIKMGRAIPEARQAHADAARALADAFRP
ncbi:MAG: hypothetical protein RL522_422 [Pseudomonadota bacterium]